MPVIETSNLTKYYGKTRGIENLNLTVEEGEIFGYIGPNGAGKSTTIRTLLGLIQPSSGQGRIFGMDIRKDKEAILARTGYMPGEAMFYGNMRVSEVIRLSQKLRGADCREEAARLCGMLELDTRKRIDELSLGNRKKAAIVCALQSKPDLCILDEPTSGLDPLMQQVFFELLHERQQAGATIFLSSHVLSEIQRHCTRAAIVRKGRLIAQGSISELTQTQARCVTLQGVTQVPAIDGIRYIQQSPDAVQFLYQGDIRQLLRETAAMPITDITITEPELEEIFLHYYETKQGGETA